VNNFLKNPNNIIVILTVLAVVFAAGAWLKPFSADKKSLDVAITQNLELLASQNISKDESLEFRYGGQKISSLISTKIRIKNTGNQPIQQSDFIEGLGIIFPSNVKIVNYKLTQIQFLKTEYVFSSDFITKENDNELKFIPTLINPGEIFDLDVLITPNKPEYVKEIKYEQQDSGLFATPSEQINPENGQKIKYNQQDIKFKYQIYGIGKINQVSKIIPNIEKKSDASQTLIGLLKLVVFLILLFSIMISIVILIKKFFPPKKKTEYDDIEKKESKVLPTIIFLLIVICPILLWLILQFYYAWFLPT